MNVRFRLRLHLIWGTGCERVWPERRCARPAGRPGPTRTRRALRCCLCVPTGCLDRSFFTHNGRPPSISSKAVNASFSVWAISSSPLCLRLTILGKSSRFEDPRRGDEDESETTRIGGAYGSSGCRGCRCSTPPSCGSWHLRGTWRRLQTVNEITCSLIRITARRIRNT